MLWNQLYPQHISTQKEQKCFLFLFCANFRVSNVHNQRDVANPISFLKNFDFNNDLKKNKKINVQTQKHKFAFVSKECNQP